MGSFEVISSLLQLLNYKIKVRKFLYILFNTFHVLMLLLKICLNSRFAQISNMFSTILKSFLVISQDVQEAFSKFARIYIITKKELLKFVKLNTL